jgi:hypothetical protein
MGAPLFPMPPPGRPSHNSPRLGLFCLTADSRLRLTRFKIKVKVTLWLAVYCQSVRLGVKIRETHDQRFFQPKHCGPSPVWRDDGFVSRFSRCSHCTYPTALFLCWREWHCVFHCNGIVRLEPYRAATPLPAALLLSRDVTADADVTCSFVACQRGRGHVTW